MFKLDRIEIQRMAVAAVGALVLTTTAVGAAVGPARAVETSAISYAETVSTDGARG